MAPDWLVFGYKQEEWDEAAHELKVRFVVVASQELREAEIQLVHDNLAERWSWIDPNPPTIYFHTSMWGCKLAVGNTYEEVLAKVMGMWSPDDPGRAPAALEPPSKAIEP